MMITMEKVRAQLKSKLALSDVSGDCTLAKSELQMDALFAALQTHLSTVENAVDEDWSLGRKEVENAWEDLTRSIQQIMIRLS